jgi:hypothetical protein
MDIDVIKFYEVLEKEIRVSTDFPSSMIKLLDWSAKEAPHPDWAKLKKLDFDAEFTAAKNWLPKILKKSPCPFPVRGAYFGLGEFSNDDGIEWSDLYFGLMAECDPTDSESKWLWCESRHYPENSYLKSKALKKGGLLCNRESDDETLGNDGNMCLSLAFAALLLRHLLDEKAFKTLGGNKPIGVVTGFDSGDMFRLGEITQQGLSLNPNAMI